LNYGPANVEDREPATDEVLPHLMRRNIVERVSDTQMQSKE
jgi:hypothetical protein